jgi:hypothetical protein
VRPTTPVLRTSIAALALALAACGRGPADNQAATGAAIATPNPSMEIVTPQDGDTVLGPVVMTRLSAHGFVVVPAGDTTPNSGHFHLFLDRDVSAASAPIPAEPDQIIHLGTGADSMSLEVVVPGAHRLIGVVGDAAHVPVQPWIVDTVRFFVR